MATAAFVRRIRLSVCGWDCVDVLKRCFGGEVRHISLLVSMGVDLEGHRDVLGIMEGLQEDGESWKSFLVHLRSRGLKQAPLIISDAYQGLLSALGDVYPQSRWQPFLMTLIKNMQLLIYKKGEFVQIQ